jgi:hypothetical protein
MSKESTKDPTKDPQFQKVVQTFLTTKPQPHKAAGKAKKKERPRPKDAGKAN